MSAAPQGPQLDQQTMTEVVRLALGGGAVEVGEWRATELGAGHTTARVYRLSGSTGERGRAAPWSLILKDHPAPTEGAGGAGSLDPRAPDYWKREAVAYQSGLLAALPCGLTAARCYAVEERPDGARLWLEDVAEAEGTVWPVERFGTASRHLGQLNGADATARTIPAYEWLAPGFPGGWLALMSRSTLDRIDEETWQHPFKWMAVLGEVVQGPLQRPEAWRHPSLCEAYPTPVAPRLRRLWEERERLLDQLARLPQGLTHGDAKRNNLFSRPTPGTDGAPSGEQTVGIDWDVVGREALGEDAGHLLGNAVMHATDQAEPRRLDNAIFRGYQDGLRDSGWAGVPRAQRAVRFAYAAHAALFVALQTGCDPATLVDERFRTWRFPDPAEVDRPLEEYVARHSFRTYALLDLADEALDLLSSL